MQKFKILDDVEKIVYVGRFTNTNQPPHIFRINFDSTVEGFLVGVRFWYDCIIVVNDLNIDGSIFSENTSYDLIIKHRYENKFDLLQIRKTPSEVDYFKSV